MISPRMSRLHRVLLVTTAAVGMTVVTTACGTENISVPNTPQDRVVHEGAVLFNQRCSGCHTLSYAATHGSAPFVRTREFNNGPNFNVRCERPMTRVLYAIENGGFSGGIMPQNIVVGQQAIEVARFVATYAGRQAPKVPGVTQCTSLAIGNPPPSASAGSTTSAPGSTTP
jgi:mono/diheme cytochrome c family protein